MRRPSAPLYFTIAAHLRDGIARGAWEAGGILPSEAQLCRQFGVSRGTVVKALDLLIKDGLAQRRQGVGTFVSRPALHRAAGLLSSFSESVREQGRTSAQRLLAEQRLTRAEAAPFGCEEAGLLIRRVRFVDDIPWALHTSVIPLEVAENSCELIGPNKTTADAEFSLYRALENAGFEIDHAHETLNVRQATSEEEELLEIEPAAVMMIHRNSFDTNGRMLESNEAIYLGSRYTYETRLVRTHAVSLLNSGRRPIEPLKAITSNGLGRHDRIDCQHDVGCPAAIILRATRRNLIRKDSRIIIRGSQQYRTAIS